MRKLYENIYHISPHSFLPSIVSPFNSFRGNYSIYEVKNYHNAETIWKFLHFPLSKNNSFHGNYTRKYGISKGVFGLLWTTWVHKDILSTYIGNVNKGKLLCVEPLKHPYVLTNNQIYFLFGFSNIRQS